jgi:AsmA protein
MLNDPAQSGTESTASTKSEPPAAKPRRVGRIVLFSVLGLVAVLAVGIGVLIALPPASLLTPIIVKNFAAQTGRELKVGGASYAFRPDFVLHFDSVALSNPQGMSGADLLQAAALDARIDLIGLVKGGGVTVKELTITQPVVTLHKDASGKANWVLPAPNSNVKLTQLSLIAGTVSYQDEQAGQSLHVTNVAGTLTQNAAALQAKLSGSTVWRAEPIQVDATIGDIQALASGAATSAVATVSSKHINGNLSGNVTPADRGHLQGTFAANTPSPADLARWFGSSPPAGVHLSPASLSGQIDATPSLIMLQKTQLKLDGADSVWDVRLDLTAKPKLTATVDAPLLDLTTLSGGKTAAKLSVDALPPGPSLTVVPAYQSLSADLDKLDQELGSAPKSLAPQSTATTTPSLWSNEAVDLAMLNSVDLDLKATAARVHVGRLDATSGVLVMAVNAGKLDMSVQQLELDKGHVTGRVQLQSVHASQAQTAITIGMDNVPVESILKEFMASAPLTGATKLDVSASGQGRTQRDLVGSLTGKASFAISKGAIAGFDLRSMILEWWRSWSFDPARKTEFSVLQGNYDIRQGDLRSVSDLAFRGKDVDISSSGNINLATGAVDQSVRLQLTPPPTHLPIPLKVGGTLSAPSVGLDWAGIFSSPGTVGSPGQVALAPEPLPADVKQKVQNLLSANANNPKLTPQTRSALQALMATPAAPSGAATTNGKN